MGLSRVPWIVNEVCSAIMKIDPQTTNQEAAFKTPIFRLATIKATIGPKATIAVMRYSMMRVWTDIVHTDSPK